MNSNREIEEAVDTLDAAREQLLRRRSRWLASINARIEKLGQLKASARNGHVKPEALQGKAKQLLEPKNLNYSGGLVANQKGRAGQSRIPAKLPFEPSCRPVRTMRSMAINTGPSGADVHLLLSKAINDVSSRMVNLLTSHVSSPRGVLEMELAFLAESCKFLSVNKSNPAQDIVILEDQAAYCKALNKQLSALRGTSLDKAEVLCAYLRAELAKEAASQQTPEFSQLRNQIKSLQRDLQSADLWDDELIIRVAYLWSAVAAYGETRLHSRERSLLDKLISGGKTGP